MSHRPWRGMDPATRDAELVEARRQIEEAAGFRRHRGRLPARSLRPAAAVRPAAAWVSAGCIPAIAGWPGQDSWLQPRFSVRQDDTPESLRAACWASRAWPGGPGSALRGWSSGGDEAAGRRRCLRRPGAHARTLSGPRGSRSRRGLTRACTAARLVGLAQHRAAGLPQDQGGPVCGRAEPAVPSTEEQDPVKHQRASTGRAIVPSRPPGAPLLPRARTA